MPQTSDQKAGEYLWVASDYDGKDVPEGYPERYWTVYDEPEIIEKWIQRYKGWAEAIAKMPAGEQRDRQQADYDRCCRTDARTVLICASVY